MHLYKYDKISKEYLGYFDAYLDPLETALKGEDVYVIPPCSVLEAPNPPVNPQNTVRYNEEEKKWEEIEDHRGLRVWTEKGDPVIIHDLGKIPENYLLERPVSLKEFKEIKTDEIKKCYNEAYFKKIVKNEVEVSIEDSSKIEGAVKGFGEFRYISVNLGDDVLEGTKEELEEIVKELYIRSMLLTRIRKSLIIEVREKKSKEQVEEVVIDFNIEEEVKKLKSLPIEELSNEFNS